jgi:hypothetical protein
VQLVPIPNRAYDVPAEPVDVDPAAGGPVRARVREHVDELLVPQLELLDAVGGEVDERRLAARRQVGGEPRGQLRVGPRRVDARLGARPVVRQREVPLELLLLLLLRLVLLLLAAARRSSRRRPGRGREPGRHRFVFVL